MKVTFDIDCTPEEARRFMGLPDLTEVHSAYLDRVKATMQNGVTPDMVEQVVRSWGPMGEAGVALWRQLVDQMGTPKKD